MEPASVSATSAMGTATETAITTVTGMDSETNTMATTGVATVTMAMATAITTVTMAMVMATYPMQVTSFNLQGIIPFHHGATRCADIAIVDR